MNKLKRVLTGLFLIAVTTATVSGMSFAAEKGGLSNGLGNGAANFAYGCQGFFGGAINDVAKLLGLKPSEIIEMRNSGQSLAAIAGEKGFSEEKVVSEILKSREKVLDQQVQAGILTEEQKKIILENMKARVGAGINNESVGPGCGRGGFGPGARGGQGGFGPGGGCCGGGVPGAQNGASGPGVSSGLRSAPTAVPNLPTGNF